MTATETTTGIRREPVAEGLFTSTGPDGRLIGSRCDRCGEVVFPRRGSCPRCSSTDVAEHLLGREGTLYTWTVQGFRPKPPFGLPAEQPFEPYGVGYVELPGETRVEARLTVADPAQLSIGMTMELTFVPLWVEDDVELVTFAFAPSETAEVPR